MAQGYASELVGVRDGSVSPASKSDGRVQGARVRRSRATLVADAATVEAGIGDNNVIGTLPKGCALIGFEVQATASQTTSTLAFGTAAAPTAFAAAKAYGTTAEAVVKYGSVAAKIATPSDEDQEVICTIGTAVMTAGSTIVIDMLYSGR